MPKPVWLQLLLLVGRPGPKLWHHVLPEDELQQPEWRHDIGRAADPMLPAVTGLQVRGRCANAGCSDVNAILGCATCGVGVMLGGEHVRSTGAVAVEPARERERETSGQTRTVGKESRRS